jgi:hypothetical protein
MPTITARFTAGAEIEPELGDGDPDWLYLLTGVSVRDAKLLPNSKEAFPVTRKFGRVWDTNWTLSHRRALRRESAQEWDIQKKSNHKKV